MCRMSRVPEAGRLKDWMRTIDTKKRRRMCGAFQFHPMKLIEIDLLQLDPERSINLAGFPAFDADVVAAYRQPALCPN